MEYSGLNNDVVLLKLKDPLTLNSKVKPACLPSEDWAPEITGNKKCYVSGWGTLWSGL